VGLIGVFFKGFDSWGRARFEVKSGLNEKIAEEDITFASYTGTSFSLSGGSTEIGLGVAPSAKKAATPFSGGTYLSSSLLSLLLSFERLRWFCNISRPLPAPLSKLSLLELPSLPSLLELLFSLLDDIPRELTSSRTSFWPKRGEFHAPMSRVACPTAFVMLRLARSRQPRIEGN
jgi:hypothetical protein